MNLKLLNEKIENVNIPISTIAEKMGVSRQTLQQKLVGKRRFKSSEADNISDILRLTKHEKTKIFFQSEADKIVK